MPISLSRFLNIDSAEFVNQGAFDPILDLDTRLFIDPHLLKYSEVPEFTQSYAKLHEHFRKIAKLLLASDIEDDLFWRQADKMMEWPEVKGLCIGYSKEGTSGSGTGPSLRRRLLKTAKTILEKGRNDLEIFELVGMLEKDFGPDRISDMVANIIIDDLATFTRRILNAIHTNWQSHLKTDPDTNLPINPFTSTKFFLVPNSLLRDLPVALDWSDIDVIARHNEELRGRVNTLIGYSWKQATKNIPKEELKKVVLQDPELVDDLVSIYKSKGAQLYDFQYDRAGAYIWYQITQDITREHPLQVSLSSTPTIEEVEQLIEKICTQFKTLLEDNGLFKLLHDKNGRPKSEEAAQLLFYGVCESYCDANNIMIARECDSGRGPIDFKFGTQKENSVLVEIKKSTNTSGLRKGIEKQLPQYMKSEKSKRAIYLVIDVGYTKAAIANLKAINRAINGSAIKIFHVNGRIQPSASKL